MDQSQFLADRFEHNREHLRAVAYRMLGSLSEADDAVQEAWLRLSRTGAAGIDNLGGWLTTVVARVCLDMLRARTSRREDSLEDQSTDAPAQKSTRSNPERETLLADSVGLALLVVLDRLTPAERLAFVLHDMFDLSFDEIASIIDRSPAAARQLASRARRRVRGNPTPQSSASEQRRVVDAFLSAVGSGDFEALIAILDPDLVVRVDRFSAATGESREFHGAENWARQALTFAKGAAAANTALINGAAGVVLAPRGRLTRAVRFVVREGKITEIEVIGDPAKLAELEVTVPEDGEARRE